MYFNPRSPYGERLQYKLIIIDGFDISIHAPLTGSDRRVAVQPLQNVYFNPRSPYGERLSGKISVSTAFQFQSTLPLRGATFGGHIKRGGIEIFQSTLPLRGATADRQRIQFRRRISIHAPLTGSDLPASARSRLMGISIHAPLTGSDRLSKLTSLIQSGFQSTLPLRGATRVLFSDCRDHIQFQSTLPLRGATKC